MTSPTVAPKTDDRRAVRYGARHVLWQLSELKRVRHCGRYARGGHVAVRVEGSGADRHAGFAGVQTCGSVWACPVCSAKIAAERQADIAAALGRWHELGGAGKSRRVAMVTLTMRHKRGQSLTDLWDALSLAWQRATGGAGWKADQLHYGVELSRTIKSGKRVGQVVTEPRIRTIRVVEVTHGANGWHVHVHALLLLGKASQLDVDRIAAGMFGRWSRSLVASGLDAPTWTAGQDGKLLKGDPSAALSEYFTKGVYSASMELARGDLKDARHGNRTPFSILRGLVEVHATGSLEGRDGLPEVSVDERIWAEWEAGSKGRRQIAWSPGLRAELVPELGDERDDEDIADEDQGGDEVVSMDSGTFRQITLARADWLVLAAFNRSTVEGLALVKVYAARAAAERDADSAPVWVKGPELAGV